MTFPEKGIEKYLGMDENWHYTEVIATGEKKQYPRCVKRVKGEELRIIVNEAYEREDEKNYYTVDILSTGGRILNIHPKHPKRPKEECLQEAAQILLQGWYEIMLNKELAKKSGTV